MIERHFNLAQNSLQDTVNQTAPAITAAVALITACLLEGHKIMTCGNGGCALNARHFTLNMLNRYETERPGLPALSLDADVSVMGALIQDHGIDEVFARQLNTLSHAGDILLVITTDGHADNINRAIAAAHARGVRVIALSGRDGGQLPALLQDEDVEIRASGHSTAHIHQVQLTILHCLCDLIDRKLLGYED